MKHFIAVAGNIGVGKSTFAALLAEKLNYDLYLEKYVANPYLADFYRDMKRWSFHSQVYFLTQNFKTHCSIQNAAISCIQDRTIYEDSEIFARNLYEQKLMSERDYQSYRDLYLAMIKVLRIPDLIIYLRATTSTLIYRIQKRQRKFERKIHPDYLEQLTNAYDAWIVRLQKMTRVLTLDTDQLNFLNDTEKAEKIFTHIQMLLQKCQDPTVSN